MLDGKLILALSFLYVTPLTIREFAMCEDRKYKLKCFRGAAKLEIFFFSQASLMSVGKWEQEVGNCVLSFAVLFMVTECGIFWLGVRTNSGGTESSIRGD